MTSPTALAHHIESKQSTTVFQNSPVPSGTVAQHFQHLDVWNTLGQPLQLGSPEHLRDGLLACWHTFWHAGMMAQTAQWHRYTDQWFTLHSVWTSVLDMVILWYKNGWFQCCLWLANHPEQQIHRPYLITKIEPIIWKFS